MEKAHKLYLALAFCAAFALLVGCTSPLQENATGTQGIQQTSTPSPNAIANTTGMLVGISNTLVQPGNVSTGQTAPPPQEGNVNVQSVPSEADIYLVNSATMAVSQNRQTPVWMDFPKGKYSIQVSKQGYYNCIADLNVTDSAKQVSLVFHLVSRPENIPCGTESCQVDLITG
ncbi:hypothetical protein COT30_02730 [Candidatus Micrarchaeota archaeon CG08_land_8_20_14_0_20_49_17]|nr:MAG: hypothetical protein AUJ13_01430 [Candidatus Micrarchaeota archaeon CG1_02_49_24]PIU09765.1 MAG: hypothetical protein COT30_02730 [Candidatus Micrarchaeota archaeon CG08_land_8_20_14_0_20_49_17]PIZ98581.1 MAG: hypothetical protein COX84_01860 [Candidatus Micrarchaeota archaeon CG_4_10_14_0_2_um_filter_49_7]HII53912.1 PEGA domain-containing protein [Candidatus Micrarchaeota archaeon]